MNHAQVPPAPPPLPPVAPNYNPYDFITQPSAPKKKSLLPGGDSKKTRILVVVVGLLFLSIIVAVVIGILGSGNKGPKSDYQSLIQQQTELIRISGLGLTKAQQAEAKNLAITTNYSLTSFQPELIGLAKKAGARTDEATLNAGKNPQTDELLTNATQTNQFDSVFISTMQANLKKYQETLKKIHDATPEAQTKETISKIYTNAGTLIGTTNP